MIDFHCHIDLYPDPKSVISACVAQGIYVLSVTTTPSAWQGTEALAQGCPRIKTALGLHPQLAGERSLELDLFYKILPNTRYVGEIGLDGTIETKPFWEDQIHVFQSILNMCSDAGGRIMSIHSRQAATEVMNMLEQYAGLSLPVLHWFSGSKTELSRAIELGCWFSVGPAMVSSAKGRALIAQMPLHRILTESDGPFVQVDKRPAIPSDVGPVLHALADIFHLPTQSTEKVVKDNFSRLVSS